MKKTPSSKSLGMGSNFKNAKRGKKARIRRTPPKKGMDYRLIADNTYDWEFWIGPEGNFIYSSPSCKWVTGYEPEQFIKNPELLEKIVHPDDRPFFIEHRKTIWEKKKPCMIDFRIIRPDGAIAWMGHVCQPVFDEEGRFMGFRGSNRDITKAKRAELELSESKEALQAILDASMESVFLLDTDRTVLAANEITAKRLGRKVEEILGKNVSDLLPQEVATRRIAYCKEAIRLGIPVYFEDEREGMYFETNIYPIYDVEGNVGKLAVYSRDITERKKVEDALRKAYGELEIKVREKTAELLRANESLKAEIAERGKIEEELRESEGKYRTIVETSGQGIWVIDKESKTTFVNRKMEEMLGYGIGEMMGKSLFEFMDSEAREIAEEYLHRRREGKAEQHEFRFRTRDGKDVFTLLETNPLLNKNLYAGALAMVTDITQRKKAEDELRNSKLLLEFVNDLMSHDLSNINQVTLSYLEFLKESELTEKQKNYVEHALYAVKNNARLIENVKRIWETKDARIVPTDMDSCIQDAIREIIAYPGKTVKISYAPKKIMVNANDLLKNVVRNLLDNAIKFDLNENVIVDIAVKDIGDEYQLSVADRGSGIPAEFKETIFSRFERLEKGVKGSGLGLHLAKIIVDSYGGKIWVEDNLPSGSIFNILLSKPKI